MFPQRDDHAVTKLDKRHPTSSLPNGSSDISPSLTFESEQVLSSWTLFKVWSWKFTTSCSIPTKWYLWYNSASDSRLLASAIMFCQLFSVWTSVSGTSTFAGRSSFDSIREKNGGVRSIAVGDVFHRLVSNLSCTAIKPNLPSFFIPYGQVGVEVNGGMMATINAL